MGTIASGVGLLACFSMVYIDYNYQKYIVQPEMHSYLSDISFSPQDEKTHKMKLISSLSPIFWILSLNCIAAYTAYFSFVDNGNDMLCKLFSFTPTQSGELLTIVYLISAFLTPVFGVGVDYFGRRLNLMGFSLIFLIIPHAMVVWIDMESKILVACTLMMIGESLFLL
jgi:nitrate/nitrite transporter NarK